LDSKYKENLVAQHKAPTIDYLKYQSAFTYLNSAIDISDGLLIDASHIAKSSNVRINLSRKILEKSELQKLDEKLYLDWVLRGGEDHILLCTSSRSIPDFIEIGVVEDGKGIAIDGAEIEIGGYIHQWQN
jgi:thiamine monophosphate kinase